MKGIDFFVEAWHWPRHAAFCTLGDLLKSQLICILREVIFDLPLIEEACIPYLLRSFGAHFLRNFMPVLSMSL
jgi:hypothetical protein